MIENPLPGSLKIILPPNHSAIAYGELF
jgi:hypothetical protein